MTCECPKLQARLHSLISVKRAWIRSPVNQSSPWVGVQLTWLLPFPDYHLTLGKELAITPIAGVYNAYVLYASCYVRYFNLTMGFEPTNKTWHVVSAQPSSPFFSSVLHSALLCAGLVVDPVATEITGVAMTQDYVNVTAALNQALGRTTLAVISGFFKNSPPSNIFKVDPVVLGRYPLVPLITILVLLFAFTALTVWLLLTSQGLDNQVDQTQVWLTSSLPMIKKAFGDDVLPDEEECDMKENRDAPRLALRQRLTGGTDLEATNGLDDRPQEPV